MDEKLKILRQKAEEILKEKEAANKNISPKEMNQILHDFQVYQIELELQNEELRNTQKELETSKNLYAQLYNNIPIGYLTLDKNSIIIQSNQTFADLVNIDFSKIIGKPFSDFVYYKDKNLFLSRFNAFFKNPENKSIELRIINEKSDFFFAKITGTIKPDIDEKNKLFLIVNDITAQKKAEEKIYYNANLLTNVFDAIISTDTEFNIKSWNQAAENIYGWKEEEVLNKPLKDFLATKYINTDFKKAFDDLKNNQYWSDEVFQTTKDNKVVPILSSVSVLKDENDEIYGYAAINRDITNRKLAEETNLKLSRAIEHSPSSIVITNVEGEIEYVNPKFCETTGYEYNEALGKNPRILKSEKMSSDIYKQMWETLLKGKEWKGELLNKKKNGELFWEYASISGIKNFRGEITHYVAVKDDITEKKAKEEQIKELNFKIEASMMAGDMAWWQMELPSGKIIFNENKAKMLGYKPENFTHYSHFTDIVHPEDYQKAMDAMTYHVEGKKDIYQVEYRIRKKDGNFLWFHDVGKIIERNKNNIIIVGIASNITNQKLTQLALNERIKEMSCLSSVRFEMQKDLSIEEFCNRIIPHIINGMQFPEITNPVIELFNKKYQLKEPEIDNKLQSEIFLNNKKIGEIFVYYDENKEFIYPEEQELISSIAKSIEIFVAKKKAIDALVESEEKFRSIAENLTDVIFLTDKQGIINYISPASRQIFERKPSEMQNHFFGEFLSKNSINLALQSFQKAIETGTPSQTLELKALKKNNEEINIELNSSMLKSENKIVGTLGVIRDITERKKIEEERKQNENRLKILVEILQYDTDTIQNLLEFTLEESILLTKSKIGYIYFYDEEKQEFTLNSWSKEVMYECTIQDEKIKYDLSKTGIWGEAVRQGKPIIVNDFKKENPLKKGYPEGHAALTKFLTVPVFSNNKIVAVVGVANKQTDYNQTDVLQLTLLMDAVWKVVERKEFEIELQQKNEELIDLNATKDKFFSIIAHDLKNPFSSILGFSELLIKNVEKYDNQKILKFSNHIYNATNQAYKLLENLLEWSKIQRKTISPKPIKANLKNIIKEIIDLLNEPARFKNIILKNFISEDIYIFCDIDMTKTIFRNLITNGIKFTENYGVISIFAEDLESFVKIKISDTGVGISDEIISKLFKIETNVSTKGTENEPGTGLGLLLCKDLTEMQGGKIWVESKLNEGSDFYFTLPKAQ